MLKYVEKHGDPDLNFNPWSIRQAAVFQRVDIQSNQDFHIFVRLSNQMKEDLMQALQRNPGKEADFVCKWHNIHVLFVKTLNENWRQYTRYLDEKVSDIV